MHYEEQHLDSRTHLELTKTRFITAQMAHNTNQIVQKNKCTSNGENQGIREDDRKSDNLELKWNPNPYSEH